MGAQRRVRELRWWGVGEGALAQGLRLTTEGMADLIQIGIDCPKYIHMKTSTPTLRVYMHSPYWRSTKIWSAVEGPYNMGGAKSSMGEGTTLSWQWG